MSPVSVLAATAAATATLAVVLVVTKLLHREVLRWRGLRSARYVAAIAELIASGVVPRAPQPGWASDPLFHDALADFRLVVTGDDRDRIDRLVAGLGVGDVLERRVRWRFPVARRLRALTSLADLAMPEHRDVFLELMDHRSVFVRVNAIRGLSRLGDTESVEAVLDRLACSGPWEAARISDALAEMGPAAVESITGWLAIASTSTGTEPGCVAATRVLGIIGSTSAERTVLQMAASPFRDVRLAAVSALGSVGTAQSVDVLRSALTDEDWSIRARAATSLGHLSAPDVAADIAELLRDRVWWVRQNAAEALCSVVDGRTALIDALDSDDRYAADAAMHALATSGLLSDAITRVAAGTGDADEVRLAQTWVG